MESAVSYFKKKIRRDGTSHEQLNTIARLDQNGASLWNSNSVESEQQTENCLRCTISSYTFSDRKCDLIHTHTHTRTHAYTHIYLPTTQNEQN